LDRPLKRLSDFERFSGQAVDVTLKVAFQGPKHWTPAAEQQCHGLRHDRAHEEARH